MRFRIQSLGPAILLVFAVAAIASAQPPSTGTLSIQVKESSLLVPTRVSYEWTDKGLRVEGRIEKTRSRYGRILGHVEIELLDAQGGLLSRHSAALGHFSPRSKDPDWASFRTLIKTVPSGTEQLRICHAVGDRRCPP
jgi:hypothetical protein